MDERYNTHFSRPPYIAALILLLLCAAAGHFASPLLSEGIRSAALPIALILSALLAILGVLSRLGSKAFIKKQNENVQVRESQEKHIRQKDLALKDLAKAKKKNVKWRRINTAYALILFVAANLIMLLLGISGLWFLSLLFVVPLFFFVVLVALQRLLPLYKKYDYNDFATKADYPLIYSVAAKAAKAVGVDGEIRIAFTSDCNAAIGKQGGVTALQIGVVLLDTLTEDELYQILLHEFGHMSKEGQVGKSEHYLQIKIETLRGIESRSRALIGSLFELFDAIFIKEFFFYRVTASQALEQLADNVEKKHGTPQTAVNALAKINYYNLFSNELDFAVEPFYAPEKPRNDVATTNIRRFRKAISERSDFWRQVMLSGIQPRNASHPIFRLRMESMGITDFTVTLPDESSDYRKECKNAAVMCDKLIQKHLEEHYDEARKDNYVKYVDFINAWEHKGRPINDENSRSLIEAHLSLQRYDEAEAICDGIIATNKNRAATAHSRFIKGMLRLKRYDKEGIGLIYEAIDINSNYINEGIEAIGEFCCKMGLQKELDEYRERAVTLAQSMVDESSKLDELLPTDNIVGDDMDKEMLESILAYFESINEDSISRIYLVKKIINESFFGSCFIIRFKDGTPQAVFMRVMDKIFNHLDTHESERQFSLFVYGRNYDVIINKINGSCVWDCADKL